MISSFGHGERIWQAKQTAKLRDLLTTVQIRPKTNFGPAFIESVVTPSDSRTSCIRTGSPIQYNVSDTILIVHCVICLSQLTCLGFSINVKSEGSHTHYDPKLTVF